MIEHESFCLGNGEKLIFFFLFDKNIFLLKKLKSLYGINTDIDVINIRFCRDTFQND